MFAKIHRSTTKRRTLGYLSVVLGAALMLLSANAGLASAAPKPQLDDLTLTALCTLPGGNAVFRVGNTNNVDVSYTWDIDKTSFSGSGTATPGHTYLYVPPSPENLRVYVDGKQQLAPKQDTDLCAFHVRPVKEWVDADGDELDSPDVPEDWKLTLVGEIETLVCRWKNDGLFCKSKAELDAKGDFAVEKRVLDVPFGSSYTITESATPDFEQEGLGQSGTLDAPQDLPAFFDSDEDIVVTVTNRLTEAEVVAATTTVETTTTSVEEETTTSTTTGDESTTTTATTLELLITGESVTTAPTSTEAPPTTLAPTTTFAPEATLPANTTGPAEETTTTLAPTTTLSASTTAPPPTGAPELTGNEVDSAEVDPAQDTLPVTGGPAGLVAGVGFALVVAGLAVLGFAWGSATPGRHARRRWARL